MSERLGEPCSLYDAERPGPVGRALRRAGTMSVWHHNRATTSAEALALAPVGRHGGDLAAV